MYTGFVDSGMSSATGRPLTVTRNRLACRDAAQHRVELVAQFVGGDIGHVRTVARS